MTIVGDAYVRIRPDDQGFEGDAEGKVTGAVKKIAIAAAGAFAATKVFDLGKDAWAAAVESQKIAAQTEAVIKSTGGAAGVTADEVGRLAEALSKKNTVDDEAIQSGQNLLLTFTNIKNGAGEGNDILTQSTQTMIDMAAAMGTDVSSGAIQLGKALNDPIAGVSALSRVGVTFTEEQKGVIKSLVETGDTAGAQKVILAELGKEFGGSAAAQATAADKLKITMGNLQEEIGAKLIPVVESLSSWLSDNLPKAMEWVEGAFEDAKPTLETIRDVVVSIGEKVVWLGERVIESVGWIIEKWDAIKVPVLAIVALITVSLIPQLLTAAAVATFWAAANVAAWVSTQAAAVAGAATTVAQMVIQGAKWVWLGITATANAAVIAAAWLVSLGPIAIVVAAVIAAVVAIIANWDKVKDAVAAVFNWVKDNWPLILAIITGPIGVAVLLVIEHWDKIKGAVTAVKNWIVDRWNEVVGFVTGLGARISSVASGMWDGIKGAFKSALNWVIEKWNSLEFKIPGFKVGPVGFDGFTLGVPDIPKFHQGGIVPGNNGQDVLALLKAGEIVLPPGARAGAAGGVVIAPTFSIEQTFGPGTNGDDVRSAMEEVARTEIIVAMERIVERTLAGVGG